MLKKLVEKEEIFLYRSIYELLDPGPGRKFRIPLQQEGPEPAPFRSATLPVRYPTSLTRVYMKIIILSLSGGGLMLKTSEKSPKFEHNNKVFVITG